MKHALLLAALLAGTALSSACAGRYSYYYVYLPPSPTAEQQEKTLADLNGKGAAGYELADQKPYDIDGKQGTVYVLRRRQQ